MKTRIKLAAVVVVFTLTFMNENASADGNETISSGTESIVEQSLEVEDWMIDEYKWNVTGHFFENLIEPEEALSIEDWMTERFNFDVTNFMDRPLEIEEWMINSQLWDLNKITTSEVEIEKALEVEPWMVNTEKWRTSR